ncbi:MAG: hypothetical protein ACREAD_07310 [Nitrosopumilaceae archaeon]
MNNNDGSSERNPSLFDINELEKKYEKSFDYNFWLHKFLALENLLKDQENMQKILVDGESVDSLKSSFEMDMHMSVFHSSETLFLILFGFIEQPRYMWAWVSNCDSKDLYKMIKKLRDKGLGSFIKNTQQKIRDFLYCGIKKEDNRYSSTLTSAEFVINYLRRLAHEYLDHAEYNSFKHGMRCYPGEYGLQMMGPDGTPILDSKNPGIFYLTTSRKYEEGKLNVRVDETMKTYQIERDKKIVMVNSLILQTIFSIRRAVLTGKPNAKYGVTIFDNTKVDDIFKFEKDSEHKGFLLKLSSKPISEKKSTRRAKLGTKTSRI